MRTLNLHEIHTLPRREKRRFRVNWGPAIGLAFILASGGLTVLFIRAAWVAARAQYL